jgi:hypothetical protein
MDDSFEDTEWDMFVGGLLRCHNVCLEFSSSLLNLCCTTKLPHLINLDKYLLLKNRKYTKFFQCWHFTRLPHMRELPLSQALNYELKTARWAHANLKWVDPVHNQLTLRGKYRYVCKRNEANSAVVFAAHVPGQSPNMRMNSRIVRIISKKWVHEPNCISPWSQLNTANYKSSSKLQDCYCTWISGCSLQQRIYIMVVYPNQATAS